MKKKFITGLFIAGACTLSAGLAGCNGQQTREAVTKDVLFDKAVDTFTTLESLSADIDMNMDFELSATGISMDIINDTVLNVEGAKDGVSHISGKTNISALGQEREMDIEVYTEDEGGNLKTYQKTSEAGSEGVWTYSKVSPIDGVDTSEMSVAQIADMYGKIKDELSDMSLEPGTVDYNDTKCYLLRGTLTGDKLLEIADSEGQNIDKESREYASLINLDTQMYFKASDETPYAIEIDMGSSLEELIQKAISDQNAGLSGVEVEVRDLKAVMIFNSFNKSNDLKVPDSVRSEAVESADSLDVQNLIMGI